MMKQNQNIKECVISSRNILLNGAVNEHVLVCLQQSLKNCGSITVDNIRKIIQYCLLEVIQQIKESNFVSAGMILNLIHNLPLNEESEKKWDIDYFLSMELYTFLENFQKIKSSQKIVLYVCEQLSARYLKD